MVAALNPYRTVAPQQRSQKPRQVRRANQQAPQAQAPNPYWQQQQVPTQQQWQQAQNRPAVQRQASQQPQQGFYSQWQGQAPQGWQQDQHGQWRQANVQQQIDPREVAAIQQGRRAMPQGHQGFGQIDRFASYQEEGLWAQDGQFNPQSYGGQQWRDGIQQAIPDPRSRMFDKSGSINAHDKRDALQQIAHLLQNSTGQAKQARFHRQQTQMMSDERRRVLAAAARDPEGFAIMGQELLLPIKDLVDYEGWARKVYRVRPLAQGELFRIAKDVRSTAWIIGQDGQGIEARLFGRYVTPSEFKIGSFPTVDIEEIYQMNYDVLDRAQDTARQEIELEEDKRGRRLMDVAAQTVNAVTAFGTLGVAAFEDIRFQVERHRLVVEKFLINRAELSDIVKTMSAQVDPVTERELILAGYIGSFLNAVILTAAGTGVQEVVPSGTVYACTGPEYMGEMGIRVELFSEPFNMFSQMRFVKGWAFGEIIGFVIVNPRSVAKGVKA